MLLGRDAGATRESTWQAPYGREPGRRHEMAATCICMQEAPCHATGPCAEWPQARGRGEPESTTATKRRTEGSSVAGACGLSWVSEMAGGRPELGLGRPRTPAALRAAGPLRCAIREGGGCIACRVGQLELGSSCQLPARVGHHHREGRRH